MDPTSKAVARDTTPPLPNASGPAEAKTDTTPQPQAKAASSSPRKARILIVEDHAFVREALVKLLERQSDLLCCGQTDSVAATPAAVAEQKPDLVLLDLQLIDGESFELIGTLRLRHPRLAILVLSQRDEVTAAERALRAGAQGYVTKQEAAAEMLTGIRAVLRGDVYVSPDLAGPLLLRLMRNPMPRFETESPPPSGPGKHLS